MKVRTIRVESNIPSPHFSVYSDGSIGSVEYPKRGSVLVSLVGTVTEDTESSLEILLSHLGDYYEDSSPAVVRSQSPSPVIKFEVHMY